MVVAKAKLAAMASHLAVGLALMLSPAAALGQAAPDVRATAPTREQIEQPAAPSEQPRSQVTVESSQAFAQEACSLAQSPLRVNLTHVQFEAPGGAEVNPALRPLLAPLAADERGDQPISVVCRIRDRVNAALDRAGYVARVQIPPQELQDGSLRLIIVAGHIVDMRVRGDAGRFNDILTRRLARIAALDPFNKDEAVRLLLLANDVPGLRVHMTLANANKGPGDLTGEVSVEVRSVQVLANVQNFGSRQLGREIGTVRAEVYGLTGLADRTYVSFSNSLQWKETHIGQFGHDFAIGDNGLRAGVRVNLAQSEPDIQNLDLQTKSLIGSVDLTMPLLRDTNKSISVTGGFEMLNQATRILSGGEKVPFTHDRTRVAFARVNASLLRQSMDGAMLFHVDGYGEVRKGLNILGGRKTGEVVGGFAPSRFEGDPEALVLRSELDAGFAIFPNVLTIEGQLFAQWSDHALLNLEEFSIGNFTFGRGYDPGANGGDRALAGRVEPHLAFLSLGPVRLEATGFFDYVRISNLDSSAGLEAHRTFKSAGGGLRVIMPGRILLEVTYARPLDKVLATDPARPTDRVLVSLTTKLWPLGGQ